MSPSWQNLFLKGIPLVRIGLIVFLLVFSLFSHVSPEVELTPLTIPIGVPAYRTVLPNGLEVLLLENRLSPMIASVVSVRAGSAYETESICGVSHLLEHLLFNGTTNRTQEQLYAEMDFYGIYNNAHTNVEFTNYIVLTEKGHIEKALDIQSDMLFQSTFPKEELEKEKGIVLNEMAKDHSNPDSYIDEMFTRKFFQETPYNLPVIGTVRSIKRITREEIIRYYRNFYSPDNMVILLAGDFESKTMLKDVEKYFGAVPHSGVSKIQKEYKVTPEVVGKTYVSRMKVPTGYMAIGIPLPSLEESDLRSLDRFLRIANRNFLDSLNEKLAERNLTELFTADVGLNRTTRIPLVEIQVRFPDNMKWKPLTEMIVELLSQFPEMNIKGEYLRQLKVYDLVEEQRLWEKPHYYGMIRGGEFSYQGMDAITVDPGLIDLSDQKFRNVLNTVFSTPRFMTGVIFPGEDTPETIADRVRSEYFSDPDYWSQLPKKFAKTSGSLKKPPMGKNSISINPKSDDSLSSGLRKKVTLKNGLVLIVDSNPGSKIFVVHLLAKNRSRMEPEGKEGITDLLHRMIGKATADKPATYFQNELDGIGAKIKNRDYDFIPYDDYSTTSEYSYIRLETMDVFGETGFRLFAEMVRSPRFDPDDFVKAKQRLMNLIQKRKGSAKWVSQDLFYPQIALGSFYRKGVYGTESSVQSIQLEDLEKYHRTYFSPSNLILSVGTSKPLDPMIDFIIGILGSWQPVSVSPIQFESSERFHPGKRITTTLGLPQSYVRLGYPVEFDMKDLSLFQIAGSLFSGQIRDELVETMGLAYSFGSGFGQLFGNYYFYATVGTRPQTVLKVENKLVDMVERFKTAAVGQKDLDRIRNRLRFSYLMRGLSRADQMYRLGRYEFVYQNPNFGTGYLSGLQAVTPEQVQTVFRTYFSKDRISTVVVE